MPCLCLSSASLAPALRDNQWKLLVDSDGKHVELYRPIDDPEERHNLADLHPDVVDRLKPIVLQWQKTLPSDSKNDQVNRESGK